MNTQVITFIPMPTGDCQSIGCRTKATKVVTVNGKHVSYCGACA